MQICMYADTPVCMYACLQICMYADMHVQICRYTGLWTTSPKMFDKFKLWCEDNPEDEFFHAPGAKTILVRKDMASGRIQPLAMSALETDAQRLVSFFLTCTCMHTHMRAKIFLCCAEILQRARCGARQYAQECIQLRHLPVCLHVCLFEKFFFK